MFVGITIALVAGFPWGIFYLGRWLGLEERHWKLLLLGFLVLLLAWFVWPTPYRDIMGGGAHVNRITGALCDVGKSC